MINTDLLEVKCSNKGEYDTLLEDYKSKGYVIVERGSNPNSEWYFKCHKK